MRIVGLVLLATAFSFGAMAMPGGYYPASVTDQEVIAAVDFAIKAKEQAMHDKVGARPAKLSLVKVLSCHKQVVAGMNFKLKIKVMINSEQKDAEVVVYRDLSGSHELTSWSWMVEEAAE